MIIYRIVILYILIIKLFNLYKKYLDGNATKNDFINFEEYGNTFEKAKKIYKKVIG